MKENVRLLQCFIGSSIEFHLINEGKKEKNPEKSIKLTHQLNEV
jgi:hypothetical protein